MKIAFDVDVLAKQMDINRMVHQVADWGYKYIEQSPHPRINPFYKHPLFSQECEAEYRKALRETGVEISSFIVVYRWSGPTEEERQFAVANWKRMIQIAVDMGVTVINTNFPETRTGRRYAMACGLSPWRNCFQSLNGRGSGWRYSPIPMISVNGIMRLVIW